MRAATARQLGDQIERVVERVVPQLVLVHTLAVRLREQTLRLQREHTDAQLRHRVHRGRQRVNQRLDFAAENAATRKLLRQILRVLLGGQLASQHQVQKSLGQLKKKEGL
jgi:hypothetical protein